MKLHADASMICNNFSIQNITRAGHLLPYINQVNSCFDPLSPGAERDIQGEGTRRAILGDSPNE